MASPAVNTATGLTITFKSGFFAQITDVQWTGVKRPAVDTTYMGTSAGNGSSTFGGRTFMAGDLSDPGELKVEFHFNPDTLPPIDAAAETITVTIPGSATPATWACSGFMTDFEVKMPLEDKMVATATLKFSGVATKTSGT